MTTYTYGQDLYDDMLAAIEGAQKQVLLETYIWKGDAVGAAVQEGAHRRGRARASRSASSTTRSPTSWCEPPFKHFPPNVKVLAYPVYSAGWRFFDLRRYGRDHRKILVVDDTVGFVGGYNIGSRRTPPSGATPTAGSPAPACGTWRGPSPTSGTCTATSGSGAASRRC